MKFLLVAPDGGIYRNPENEPICADTEESLKAIAFIWSITDYRIVRYDLPWQIIEVETPQT